MPEFQYIALARDGKEIHGREFADSTEVLKQLLKKRRLILVKAKPQSRKRIAQASVGRLINDLADLLDSGIVLDRALQIIASDNTDPNLAGLAARIRDDLKAGQSLSQAMRRLGSVDPLVAPMIYAGEVSGQLPTLLNRLSDYFVNRRELRKEIAANLAYPVILLIVSVLSLIGLAVYVVPVFRELFEDDLGSLPLGTRMVFASSDWLVQYGGITAGALLGSLLLLAVVVRYSSQVRLLVHRFLLSSPLIGQILALREAANFTSVLGILLTSGIPLVQAMEIARNISLNRHFQAGMDKTIGLLRRGSTLASAVREIPALPNLTLRLITIGDEGGRLGKTCTKAAGILEKDLRLQMRSLVSLMEPAIILAMGGLVGFVVVSMLLAVFGLTDLAST